MTRLVHPPHRHHPASLSRRPISQRTSIGTYIIEAGGDFLVGEVEGSLVAMGSILPNDSLEVEVNHIRVHPAMRRQGVGRTLMAALEDSARRRGFRRVHLDTATNQPEAVAFYKALGYLEIGTETRPEWQWTLVYFTKDLTTGQSRPGDQGRHLAPRSHVERPHDAVQLNRFGVVGRV